MDNDLIRRLEDLNRSAKKHSSIVCSSFLTPAEQQEVRNFEPLDHTLLFSWGGDEACERKAAFFLPDYISEDEIHTADMISAVRISVKQGELSHRDILGASIGSGLKREVLGDIRIFDTSAFLFTTDAAAKTLAWSLEQVGRLPCKVEVIPLSEVPQAEIHTKEVVFTVQTIRLDAVISGLFRVSRTDASEYIKAGAVSLNYLVCMKPDIRLKAGDIVSVRGHGKGVLSEIRGESKKGRIFLSALRYI